MNTIKEIEDILQTYTVEDILDENELTEADMLLFLVEEGFLHLPDPRPL